MVYGELGVVPLDVDIKLRMLTYWARLCLGNKHKIFNTIYSLLHTLDEKKIFKSEWIQTVKTTLNYCGFSGFWLNQTLPCSIEAFKGSQAKTKESVYAKMAGINITRRKMYYISYH